jgi:hypothetical protein
VPAVARRDQNRFDAGPCQQFLRIPTNLAVTVAVGRVDHALDGLAPVFADVTVRYHLYTLVTQEPLQVLGAAPANADRAHHNPVVRRSCRTLALQCY